jgi:hypothetical protein
MKRSATLTNLLTGGAHVRHSARKLLPHQSYSRFKSQIAHRNRFELPEARFWFWVKWSVSVILFWAFIWYACETVQYLRGLGGK